MKNIRYKLIVFLLIPLLAFMGCEESFEEINENPNGSTDVPPDFLVSEAMILISAIKVQTMDNNGAIWAQQYGPNNTLTPFRVDDYDVAEVSNWSGNLTFNLYLGASKNLDLAFLLAGENGDTIQQGQIRILQAFNFHFLTDAFGDTPVKEAGNFNILYPDYDAQEDIYPYLITLLDEGIDLINNGGGLALGDGDLVFGGDTENWIRFANSLKLRILMRMSYATDVSSQLSAFLAESPIFIEENSQNALFAYYEQLTNSNLYWRTWDNFGDAFGAWERANGQRVRQLWMSLGEPLVDIMNDLEDPRLGAYGDRPPGFDEYVGNPVGGAALAPAAERTTLSLFFIRSTMPDIWMTASETHLLLAEAYKRGLANGDENIAFQEGVAASMDFYDISPNPKYIISDSAKTAYLASLPDVSLLSADEGTKEIQLQQYIALFGNGTEAWAHVRRTDWPEIPVPTNAPIGQMIARYPYDIDELNANPNAPQSQSLIDQNMWFDVPNPTN